MSRLLTLIVLFTKASEWHLLKYHREINLLRVTFEMTVQLQEKLFSFFSTWKILVSFFLLFSFSLTSFLSIFHLCYLVGFFLFFLKKVLWKCKLRCWIQKRLHASVCCFDTTWIPNNVWLMSDDTDTSFSIIFYINYYEISIKPMDAWCNNHVYFLVLSYYKEKSKFIFI